MLRFLAIGLAALLATACSYGSAVDIAPYKDRLKQAVVSPGDYCEMSMATKPYQVKSTDGCVRLDWVPETRSLRMIDLEEKADAQDAQDDGPQQMDVAIVSLGSGIYAGQVDVDDDKDKHQINVFVVSGDAFATITVLQDEELVALAKKHSRLTWADMPTGGEEPSLFTKRPWIKDGSVKDVKAFLKEAARQGMRQYIDKDEPEEISVGVLDKDKTPNHAASNKQIRDAENVVRAIRRLTPK